MSVESSHTKGMKDSVESRSIPRLIPVTKWNEHHEWPPIGGLRHLVFHEGSNGFHSVIRRVGRRVLIDEQAFFTWVDRQGSQGGAQ
ncbi:MAG TPA: hypothetical protein PLT86_11925 [Candidatus Latescibacteria bacterium]|nr:hypothetical protein [Candidatus Latescibacterota bacterium]HPC44826.1 hypothetical protein [Candidatus Latescibacterota bacterium]HQI77353.1 hypothetical protein [Candidatus Latescibacterota bacterium]HQK22226.1 hypothetical protein [Candidatus Latescibacterota bacterium]